MAITIKKVETEYEYIPVSERGEEKPATFVIKQLPRVTQALLEDSILKVDANGGFITMAQPSYILNAFVSGVVDTKNILDEKGKEIKPLITKDGVDKDFLDLLPSEIVREVGEVIVNISKNPQDAEMFLGSEVQE